MTHRAEGNSGGSQADETSISRMWLMDCVGILVAELV